MKQVAMSGKDAFATLRRFTRPAGPPRERCELCGMAIAPVHRHLLEVENRRVVCSCDPCALTFNNVIDGRFKLIPRDVRSLPGFRISDEQWESLALPINLAFSFHSTPKKRVIALYPSPAGATESLLPLSAWQTLVDDNPALGEMAPDVEALLVNRVGAARIHYIAPIDVCFELVGIIRLHWRGFAGGDAVWQEIDRYFTGLEAQARPLVARSPENAHA